MAFHRIGSLLAVGTPHVLVRDSKVHEDFMLASKKTFVQEGRHAQVNMDIWSVELSVDKKIRCFSKIVKLLFISKMTLIVAAT